MTEFPPQRPASRYGQSRLTPGTRRRVAFALGVLVVAAGVIVAVVAYQRFSGSEVQGEINAYQVLNDHTVSVTISVTRTDPSRPASCIVRARSSDGDETGRREILVPPATDTTVLISTTVKSYKRAFVGDIYGCGGDVPAYLTSP